MSWFKRILGKGDRAHSEAETKPAESSSPTRPAAPLEVGQWVVLRGKALGCIKDITAENIVIEEADLEKGEESKFKVPADRAADVLRPMVTAAEARSLLDQLGREDPTADSRSVSDRSVTYRRVHKGGEIGEQVKTLGAIYRHPKPDYPERQYQDLLEKVILPELAHALKRSRKAVKADVRAAVLGQKPPAGLALPDHSAQLAKVGELPTLAGYEAIGPFFIDTKLAVGEHHADVTTAAEVGMWFAYRLGDMDADDFELLAVHESAVNSAAQLKNEATQIGEVVAEGAKMAIFDAAEADDEEFADETSKGDGIIGQRCAVISLGGDGRFPVFAATKNKRAICIRVAF